MAIQYQTIDATSVKRIDADGSESFGPPNEPTSAFSIAYQTWRAQGNTPRSAPLTFAGAIAMTGRVRTTTAAPTEIYRATLRPMTGYRALGTLLGVDAGNGDLRQVYASIVAKRLNAGALLVGPPVVIANHQDAGASAWALSASVSGNDFVIAVTGAAGRTIDWLLDGSIVSFTPGGA
jgi:hypothetical protein